MATNRAKEILVESVTELLNSDQYKAALAFRKQFNHPYSFRNLWLIFSQCPEASMVAGYRKWQSAGRQVRKGEKSIAILAPMIKKDEATKEGKVIGFRSVNVFDVAQTEGEAIPQRPQANLIAGDSEAIQSATTALIAIAESLELTVDFKALDGPCGFYQPADAKIVVSSKLEPAHQLKTLVHELAHAMLDHGKSEKPMNVLELEAESAAYIVCDSLGLDSSDYSFAYLAGWADDPEQVITAADCACKLADAMLNALQEIA